MLYLWRNQTCKMPEISSIDISAFPETITITIARTTTSPKPLSPLQSFVPNRPNANTIFNHTKILQHTLPIIA